MGEHLKNLGDMLGILHKNNLKCNATKCHFVYQELDFLGHSISKDGIRISRDKFKIIDKISPPKTRKSLQRLIGLIQYFRRFIRGFSQKTFNMHQLLKADTPFVWSTECDKELQYIKQALLSDPILIPLNPNKDVSK